MHSVAIVYCAVFAIVALLATAPHSFTAMFGGDIMLNGVPVGRKSLVGLSSVYKPASVAFANLEIPLTNAQVATTRKSAAELKAKSQFILKADPRHAPELKDVGIDLVSLGNNHAMDYRVAGLKQMTGLLDKLGIGHSGAAMNTADASKVAIFTLQDGTRIGLVSSLAFQSEGGAYHTTAATDRAPGVMYLNFHSRVDVKARAYLHAWIAEARSHCDFVVVGLHWGIERQPLPSPYQVALGRACIEEGADVVWGHHPHVLQGAELYKGKPILYSMGNLVSPLPSSTGLVRLFFREGRYVSGKFLSAQVSGGRTRLIKGDGAMHSLSQRLAKRFPNRDARPLF